MIKGHGTVYRPEAGDVCLISGPHCDDDNGYVFTTVKILWKDDTFIVYRKDNCWPVVHKWEHIIAKPLPERDENCEVCGKVVPGFEYRYCCNLPDCGCGGKPVEPCVCSEECWGQLVGAGI